MFAYEHSSETSSVPLNSSADLGKVKNEPAKIDLNPKSLHPLVSYLTVENKSIKPLGKRKEREKKVKPMRKKASIRKIRVF